MKCTHPTGSYSVNAHGVITCHACGDSWNAAPVVEKPDPLETVQRWTWEVDGMERDHDNGPWVRLEDVKRALGVSELGHQVVRTAGTDEGKPTP